jgi:hypothetical protein
MGNGQWKLDRYSPFPIPHSLFPDLFEGVSKQEDEGND